MHINRNINTSCNGRCTYWIDCLLQRTNLTTGYLLDLSSPGRKKIELKWTPPVFAILFVSHHRYRIIFSPSLLIKEEKKYVFGTRRSEKEEQSAYILHDSPGYALTARWGGKGAIVPEVAVPSPNSNIVRIHEPCIYRGNISPVVCQN